MIKIHHLKNKQGFVKVFYVVTEGNSSPHFSDDEYIGVVSEHFFSSYGQINKETNELELYDTTNISLSELVENLQTEVYEKTIARLLDYVAKSERAAYDCEIYLKKWETPQTVINLAIEYATSHKWVSDERYAMFYAEDALFGSMSPMNVKYKLIQKKIAPDIVERVISSVFDSENLSDLLDQQLEILLKRYSNLPKRSKYEKIATALYRKGFPYNDYEEKLKRLLENSEP
jgi:SOS response regulatory protein OraA/RecX